MGHNLEAGLQNVERGGAVRRRDRSAKPEGNQEVGLVNIKRFLVWGAIMDSGLCCQGAGIGGSSYST